MSKTLRIVLIILVIDLVVAGAYFLFRGHGPGGGEDAVADTAWTTMDEYFQPSTEVEQFIKTDYEAKELLPLQFRDFGRSPAVLKRFRGAKLAGAGVSVLEMQFKGLEDWALVEIWYKGEEGREIRRTILYILTQNAWKVGDSGRLAD